MNCRVLFVAAVMTSTLLWLAPGALAEVPTGRVTGKGTVIVERQPDLLRIQVDLVSDGKDIHDVLAKLNAKQESVRKLVLDAGAVPDSVQFGSPDLTLAGDKGSKIQQLMAMQMGGRGKPPTPPAPYKVTVQLTAEWPLKGATADERIINAVETEKRISAIEFGTPKAATTPAAAEDEEERAGMSENALVKKPGEPTYIFVKTLIPEERTKIMAEAYAKAKVSAQQLAQAAGRDLGDLVQIGGSAEEREESADSGNPYAAYFEAQLQQATGQTHTEAIKEATGSQPAKVELMVEVSATFAIK